MLIKQKYDENKNGKDKRIRRFFTEKFACSTIVQLKDKDENHQ